MKRKIFRILLLLFIFYITGCGKNVRVQENMDNQRGIEEDKGDQKDTASSMGRYIETAYSLPEGLGYKRELIRLSDGSLYLTIMETIMFPLMEGKRGIKGKSHGLISLQPRNILRAYQGEKMEVLALFTE